MMIFLSIRSTSYKKCDRPWQDSNLQSSDPKSDALSIRPHGPAILSVISHLEKSDGVASKIAIDQRERERELLSWIVESLSLLESRQWCDMKTTCPGGETVRAWYHGPA